MSIRRISFRCKDHVKAILEDVAERIPDDERPFKYYVDESRDIVTNEQYVIILPLEETGMIKNDAAKLVQLIYEKAGEPAMEALLWGTDNEMGVISLK